MERKSGTFTAKRAYFEAFPATFDDFEKVFGYEENQGGETYGELYEKSLDYISEFFYMNEEINLFDFSNKVIQMCINGRWQADGVNYLKANVVNIITSSNHGQDCYYNHYNVFICYSDTLRETMLSRLALFRDDEILSFWRFYLDGVKTIPIDVELYQRTRGLIQQYPSLVCQLDRAYILESQRNDMPD